MEFRPIEEVVENYYNDKQAEKVLKASLTAGNEFIKDYMKSAEKDSEIFGDYKVTVSVTDKSTFNEDKLLKLMKSEYPAVVKTKEYVDIDALEDAMYKGLIPERIILDMDSAKEPKEVVTLRVSKPKKKKEDNDD